MNDGRYRPRVLLVEVDATDNPAKCTDCVLKHQIAACLEAPCCPDMRVGKTPQQVYYTHAPLVQQSPYQQGQALKKRTSN